MPRIVEFQLKLDEFYEQGMDLCDAVAEIIERQSEMRYLWLGGDEYGMGLFYDRSPAVYCLDTKRSSFNTGHIILQECSENLSKRQLTELIEAGCLKPKKELQELAEISEKDCRERAEAVSAAYFDNIAFSLAAGLSRLSEHFELNFT